MTVAAADLLTLGFHIHDPVHFTQAAETGYGAIRFWDTGVDWANVAPQEALLNFNRINTMLAASEKAHLKVLWTLGNTPRWASARPNEKCAFGFGCAAEPRDIEDWRRYVRTIATTFRGRIECYEPWNEVSFPTDPVFKVRGAGGATEEFFTGSVAQMVELARVAYEEIKRADPDACVLSPSFHNSGDAVEKLDQYLSAGGGRYFDVLSEHFYFGDWPAEETVGTNRAVRRILVKHGLGNVPIWNTEVGVQFALNQNAFPNLSREERVYALTLRTFLVNASEGVARVYWYAWDNRNFGFVEPDSNADLGVAAAKAAVHQLDHADAIACKSTQAIWTCSVRAGRRAFKVMWLEGKAIAPRKMILDRNATRWGHNTELLAAGRNFMLDARPIIIDDNR